MTYEKKHILLFSAFILLFAAIFGCKKEKTTINMHLNYFGLIPGRYVVYDVQEMYHDVDLIIPHDTLTYQLKTYIGTEYIDNFGRTAREFRRYKRNDNTQDWTLSDVWTAIIDNYNAELVEENQRIVKLVFAPTSDKSWNPNAFNGYDPLTYSYSKLHKPMTIGSLSFDSTITVDQENFTSMIDHRTKYETYAANVGLVKKWYKDLTIAGFDSTNVKKGTEIFYTCIEYGFE